MQETKSREPLTEQERAQFARYAAEIFSRHGIGSHNHAPPGLQEACLIFEKLLGCRIISAYIRKKPAVW